MKKLFCALFLSAGCAFCGENLLITENGTAKAVIVTADKPSPVAEFAARELADRIRESTGASLPMVAESRAPEKGMKIYVGATKAAEQAGVGQGTFTGEAFAVKALGGNLYLTGGENEKPLIIDFDPKRSRRENGRIAWTDNGFVRDARRGTLYSVCRFLDKQLGVRWLWPGQLGTYVPRKAVFAIDSSLDYRGAPAFLYRKYRIWQITTAYYRTRKNDIPELAFSEGGLKNYIDALRHYLLIHQEGDSEALPAPAAHLCSWWGIYGKKHPEWFAMRDDGERKPSDRSVARLCVSNPDLAKFIVEKQWDGSGWIGLGEADTRGFCRCGTCMSWDAPQPSGFQGYSTTNRYIRYARRVRELARKRNPDVKISILMYMDYIMPPTGNPDLSWMYGKFVPWGSGVECWYPMSEKSAREIQNIWDGWRKTGIRMHYRPNYLLSGYTLPGLDLRQSGEMLRFAGNNGMIGFDYDSLFGFWATKGPMLYMHMRLGTDPSLTIDEILEEYYGAFGPAAEHVRKYFDCWIAYTRKLSHGGVTYGNASEAAEKYPPEVFAEPEKILADALAAAKKSPNPEFAARVAFLRDGLKHGRLCAEFSGLYAQNKFTEARSKLDEVIAFRRLHEKDFICDYNAALFSENRGYKGLADFLRGEFRYFSNPPLAYGKFKKDSVESIRGIRAGKWGLTLPKKAAEGEVVFRYDAGENNSFVNADLEVFARAGKLTNTLEFSPDGGNYQTIDSNLEKKKITLSSLVAGRKSFHLRFRVKRNTKETDAMLALITFRLDYTKKNPEVQPKRRKLDPGTGWIDFKGEWFFRKDIRNTGLAASEMLPGNFKPAEWTKVEVPARLERTAVGPYLGTGWYAVEFMIPKDWAARSMDLLFEAVDEQAWVYLNGRLIGEHTVKSEGVDVGILWDEPFLIHAKAEDLRPGGKNLLIVRTHASKGAHGIWKPVKIRPVDASAQ